MAATWKVLGAKNRESALERYCGPLMDRRLDQIRRADVIAILASVMAEKPAIGSKLHGWIRGALAWGVAREHLEFNVADASARRCLLGGQRDTMRRFPTGT